MQGDGLVAKLNPGVRIGCESGCQSFGETRLELANCLEAMRRLSAC